MKQECIQAVNEAAGRSVKDSEIKTLEDAINRHLRNLARKDRTRWASMPEEARLMEAATSAGKELAVEAQLKKYRAARQILRHDALMLEYARLTEDGHTGIDSLRRLVTFDPDTKSGLLPLESLIKGTQHFYLRNLVKSLEVASPKVLGLFSNRDGMKALLDEMWGRDSGNLDAKAGARTWKETTESMRQAFNNMGGKIGRLENWHLPQHHSDALVRGDGSDVARDAWVSKTLPLLDRAQYVHEDGSLMSNAEINDVSSSF